MIYTRGNLIIYDSTGKIFYQSGFSTSASEIPNHEVPKDVPYLIIPYDETLIKTKKIVSVNVSKTPNEVIFEDIIYIPTLEDKVKELNLQTQLMDIKLSIIAESVVV